MWIITVSYFVLSKYSNSGELRQLFLISHRRLKLTKVKVMRSPVSDRFHSSTQVLRLTVGTKDSGTGVLHFSSQTDPEASPAVPHQSLPLFLDPRTDTSPSQGQVVFNADKYCRNKAEKELAKGLWYLIGCLWSPLVRWHSRNFLRETSS